MYKYDINNLPLNVKDIKNISQFLRDITEQEKNKYWVSILNAVKHCDMDILGKNETPLQRKRQAIQQYLVYKNNNNIYDLRWDLV